jgi:hypothetical protein
MGRASTFTSTTSGRVKDELRPSPHMGFLAFTTTRLVSAE